jgi:hypothetical protein
LLSRGNLINKSTLQLNQPKNKRLAFYFLP